MKDKGSKLQTLWARLASIWAAPMGVWLIFVLLIFSVQFLFPWDQRSWQRFFRSIGIGVALMAVAAIWWTRREGTVYTDTARWRGETQQFRDVRRTRDFLLAFTGMTTLFLLVYSSQTIYAGKGIAGALYVFGAGGLLGLASLLSGAILGLLFGIPRSNRERESGTIPVPSDGPGQSSASSSQPALSSPGVAPRAVAVAFRSNTNLEEISDWLTKIIVGLGLTQLSDIPDYVRRLTAFVSHPADPSGAAALTQNVAFAIMTAFSACGFLMGYLLTRLFLQGALVRAEQPEAELSDLLRDIAQGTPPPQPPAQTPPDELLPERDVAVAVRAEKVTAGISEATLRAHITRLAREYEQLRGTMSPGVERTHAMEKIAAQMRTLAFSAAAFLEDLKNSSSEGERLAAVMFLQVNFDPRSISWLADRIAAEKPFIGYHAALALLAAVRAFTTTHRDELRDAIGKGMAALKGKESTDRYQVLRTAKAELEASQQGAGVSESDLSA